MKEYTLVNPTAKQIKMRRLEELCNWMLFIAIFLLSLDAMFFFGSLVALNKKIMIIIGILGAVLLIAALFLDKVISHAKRKAI